MPPIKPHVVGDRVHVNMGVDGHEAAFIMERREVAGSPAGRVQYEYCVEFEKGGSAVWVDAGEIKIKPTGGYVKQGTWHVVRSSNGSADTAMDGIDDEA